METDAIYFPYYRNHWALIEFKPPEVRLVWFETMSRMAFGDFPKPEKPIEGLSSPTDIAVWEAYNTFYPIISKFKKTDKRYTEEFRQKGRENGLRGGRPRKDGSDAAALPPSSSQPTSDEFATHHEDLQDPVLDISRGKSRYQLSPKEQAVQQKAKEWLDRCPNVDVFSDYIRANCTVTSKLKMIGDRDFHAWAYDKLKDAQFASTISGQPITNMPVILAKLYDSYLKEKKREKEDQEKAEAAERNFAINIEQRQQNADVALLREREEIARRFREEKKREEEIEKARKTAAGEGTPKP